ncbi:hypothetical protein F3Y22_tig00012484pilonHSYRG00012 [Hibiscus syriacus]|uniref:Uncharacterized protein n=1 Tax=Hibiscus syriacus TaxID=106335 RepID=A0A6A3C3A0_HIBSY|nr:hypothetical protein F3Y22_tig00012484pilonHSYRG00012 [Hibiscus syriacus]
MDVGGSGGVDRHAGRFDGKITTSLVVTCIVAASSGLIFGYGVGISGGVTTMQPFLKKFFPSELRKATEANNNIYYMYDTQVLSSFTSSLYTASLVASRVTGSTKHNGATPIYLSEVAPPKWRGAFNTGFQFFTGIGVEAANSINFGTAKQNTPSSLIERGKEEQARESIWKVRGKDCDVEAELTELKMASDVAKEAKREPFVTIFERHYRPHLVGVAIVLAVTTGVSAYGHKGNQQWLCRIATGFNVHLCCWVRLVLGPLSWLIPSEIFPIKIRSTGQSISVTVNFTTTFVLSQTSLTMLCHFKYGAFLFYAAWITFMTVFVVLFLPETKGVPLDSMNVIWQNHWYWRRFVRG